MPRAFITYLTTIRKWCVMTMRCAYLSGYVLSVFLCAAMPAQAQDTNCNNPVFLSEGNATFYADEDYKKRTTSGKPLHRQELTAAHSSLEMGKRVMIVSKDTGRKTVVEITDKGPNGKNATKQNRIVDLTDKGLEVLHLDKKYGEYPIKVLLCQ